MITAIDTNILLDIFLPDPQFGPASKEALAKQFEKGSLIICDIVYAEIACFFESKEKLDLILKKMGIRFVPMAERSAYAAGESWQKYSKRSSKKGRVLADFLIGAFALYQAEGLLTRDRGFYRDYFSHLKVIAP